MAHEDSAVIGRSHSRQVGSRNRRTHIAPTATPSRRAFYPHSRYPRPRAYCGVYIEPEDRDLAAVDCEYCLRRHRAATDSASVETA